VKLVQVFGDSPWMRQEVMQASGTGGLELALGVGAVLLAAPAPVEVEVSEEEAVD
jgi:uncharacterized membrane protein (UPF0136 family)